MRDLKLRIHLEGSPEKTVSVASEKFIIGRLPTCDLCLPFSEISRQHSHIVQNAAGDWLIEDLGSMNGTLLNQTLLKGPRKINHGDQIQLGNVILSVELNVPFSAILEASKTAPSNSEVRTILRNAEDLKQQWMKPEEPGNTYFNQETAIARLQNLVEIAKALNSAESIEAIFSQVQKVVFHELKTVDNLALLVDVEGTGKLKLLQAATRNAIAPNSGGHNISWISRTICKQVFLEKVAIKTVDAQSDKRFESEDSILSKGIHGALAVPIWDQNKIVGVLYANAQFHYLPALDPSEDEDLSFFSTIAHLVASSVQRWLLTRKLQGEEKIRQQLERYHSPAVVQQLIAVGGLEKGRLLPVEADISILFADLVGFSALSERLTPSQISDVLNRFFEEMLKPIFAAGGTLDKFIGDCIMAFFGAPEPQDDHPERAVKAALTMLDRLDELNAAHTWLEPLQLRIAINSGKAVVGDVGSLQRVDYTVLGTTVNLAARMEAICPPRECVLSEETYNRLQNPKNFIEMGEFRFKGIERPVLIYQSQRHPSA